MTYASLIEPGAPYAGADGRAELDRLLAGATMTAEQQADEVARRNARAFRDLMSGHV